jgi:hypothetical protein
VAHDRDQWRALVNTTMKYGLRKMKGISWLAEFSSSRRTLFDGINWYDLYFSICILYYL